MKCPTCGENTPDAWQQLLNPPSSTAVGIERIAQQREIPAPDRHRISFDYMRCANEDCAQAVVRGHDNFTDFVNLEPVGATDTWLVFPRRSVRRIDPLVPDQFAADYHEAVAILDASHRMAAVLARSILADLLETYAGLKQFGLADRIDAFLLDTSRPHDLRQNLHYLREIADLSAHTKKNDQLETVKISREEAEWTITLIERLFDHFVVTPDRDKKLREQMDAKLADAGRKAIKPLPPDPEPQG